MGENLKFEKVMIRTYNIIRNNSTNLLELTLITDGLNLRHAVCVEKGLGSLSSFNIMTNRVNVTQKSYLGKQ